MTLLSGLHVPGSKLEAFSKLGSTFLVKRFDRDSDKRIHFASAMTMLAIEQMKPAFGVCYGEN